MSVGRESWMQPRARIDFEQVRSWLEANGLFYQDDDLAMLTPLRDAETAAAGRQLPRGYVVEDEPEAFTRQSDHGTGRAADSIAFDETLQQVGVIFRQLARQVQPIMAAASGLFRYIDDFDPDRPPTDPRERALWLRQHRNTGPQQHRLDGRRRS